jgi:RNA recognition motif-containing protein
MSLFIGNISKNVRKSDMVDEFEKFGKCEINFKVPHLEPALAILLSIIPSSSSPKPHCFYLLTSLLIGFIRFH